MFNKKDTAGYKTLAEGIEMKTLVYGENTLMSEFKLGKSCTLPLHSHPNEQTGYLISGKIRLKIGRDVFEILPGDSWCILPGIEHGADVIDDSVAIEIFSPVRKNYLP